MISGAGPLAAREGLGLPAGDTVDDVLRRAPLLPSAWGGQDVVAAWARGGPEEASAVEQAVADGVAERVWGPHGRLWLTTPAIADAVRIAYRDLAQALPCDEDLAGRLHERWPPGATLTVGRAAGLLACPRGQAGALLQRGCVLGWWRPTSRDEDGRLRFEPWDPPSATTLPRAAACGRLVAAVVAAWGPCRTEVLKIRLGAPSVVADGVRAAVHDGVLERDGEVVFASPGPSRPTPSPVAVGRVALLGRGDPFAALAEVDASTAALRDGAEPPPLVVLDGRLIGVWSERWVRRTLHLDLACSDPSEPEHERTLADRIESLGRLRAARRTRWRRLGSL